MFGRRVKGARVARDLGGHSCGDSGFVLCEEERWLGRRRYVRYVEQDGSSSWGSVSVGSSLWWLWGELEASGDSRLTSNSREVATDGPRVGRFVDRGSGPSRDWRNRAGPVKLMGKDDGDDQRETRTD